MPRDGETPNGQHGWLILKIKPGFDLHIETASGWQTLTYTGRDAEDPKLLVWTMSERRTLILDVQRSSRLIPGFEMLAGPNRGSPRSQRASLCLRVTPSARARVTWDNPNHGDPQ